MKANSELKLAFVGAGAMGGAMAIGLLEEGVVESSNLYIADPSHGVQQRFSEMGAQVFEDAQKMLKASSFDAVILAVKPQILDSVLAGISYDFADELVISIAAGVSISYLEERLEVARVIRIMPNLGVQKKSGAFAVSLGNRASGQDITLVEALFAPLGTVRCMREDQLDVAGVVAGSGPAFFALLVDELTSSAIKQGLGADDARSLIEATMLGTARILIEDECKPRELIEAVCSPGGTTIAAMRTLEPDFIVAVDKAVAAALARTKELAAQAG